AQRVDVDDAEALRRGRDLGADVKAAATAQQEVPAALAEAIALHRAGAMLAELDRAGRIGRGPRAVGAAERALAGVNAPGRRRQAGAIGESDRAAMARAGIHVAPGAHASASAHAATRLTGATSLRVMARTEEVQRH